MNNDTRDQAAKNKNKEAGLPIAFDKIGNRIITIDADNQLDPVENATIAGSTISGIYNQTTGPSDNPKAVI